MKVKQKRTRVEKFSQLRVGGLILMNLEEIINARREQVKKATVTPKKVISARGSSPFGKPEMNRSCSGPEKVSPLKPARLNIPGLTPDKTPPVMQVENSFASTDDPMKLLSFGGS